MKNEITGGDKSDSTKNRQPKTREMFVTAI